MIDHFFLYLAWFLSPSSLFLSIAIVKASMEYERSLEQIKDAMKGLRATFNPVRPFIVFIISTIYLISYYF